MTARTDERVVIVQLSVKARVAPICNCPSVGGFGWVFTYELENFFALAFSRLSKIRDLGDGGGAFTIYLSAVYKA
jgi:hypothetical protein